jgi:hypothetical protein
MSLGGDYAKEKKKKREFLKERACMGKDKGKIIEKKTLNICDRAKK